MPLTTPPETRMYFIMMDTGRKRKLTIEQSICRKMIGQLGLVINTWTLGHVIRKVVRWRKPFVARTRGLGSSLLYSNMPVTKRIRIFTAEDVAEHNSFKSCWVSRNGKVYDVTSFLSDHPGGDDLIVKYAGEDIGEVMQDPKEHEHSDSAYDMLDEFLVGRVGTDAGLVDEGLLSLLLSCILLIGCQTGFQMSTFTPTIRTLSRILLKMNSLT